MDSKMKIENEKKKEWVRERYSKIAEGLQSGCECNELSSSKSSSCCESTETADSLSTAFGYEIEDLRELPEGADLGLGCGNPTALATLKNGEIVLDLGAGAGIDCFIAAQKVGQEGKVIGVDMTPSMLQKARENAIKGNYTNVEFRLGEIENLPVADNSVDVIISNCVINLVPDKKQVFTDAYRVLKPGGRIMVSDIVLLKPLPDFLVSSSNAYTSCVSGAVLKDSYINIIKEVGFTDIEIIKEVSYPVELMGISEEIMKQFSKNRMDFNDLIASIGVRAIKTK